MATWYTIGQFSKMADVSTRTLRVYEELGLIKSQSRGENGYRYFDDSQSEILERIKGFKGFGFTLKEIKALLIADMSMTSDKLASFLHGRMSALNEIEGEIREQRLRIKNALAALESKSKEIPKEERSEIMKNFEHSIPMMTIRDFILFPGAVRSIWVGRDFTKASIRLANEVHGGRIVVITQKDIEKNERPGTDEFFDVGTVCQIVSTEDLPEGQVKVVVRGEERCHIVEVIEQEDARFCRFAPLEAPNFELSSGRRLKIIDLIAPKAEAGSKRALLVSELRSEKDAFKFVMRASDVVSIPEKRKEFIENRKARPDLFLVDAYDNEEKVQINYELARIQEILAESDGEKAFDKLEELLLRV